MHSPKEIFEYHLSALPHYSFIPTLNLGLRDAINALKHGKITPEKYSYYLMHGMLNGFGIVQHNIEGLERQNAIFKSKIQRLEEQINELKNN